MNEEWKVIHVYTRAQAIDDGTLIDVSGTANDIGFRMPTAFTAAAWNASVTQPQGLCGSDEYGRLLTALWALKRAIRESSGNGSELRFFVEVRQKTGEPPGQVELKAVCGPSDDASPCLTVMLPDED